MIDDRVWIKVLGNIDSGHVEVKSKCNTHVVAKAGHTPSGCSSVALSNLNERSKGLLVYHSAFADFDDINGKNNVSYFTTRLGNPSVRDQETGQKERSSLMTFEFPQITPNKVV